MRAEARASPGGCTEAPAPCEGAAHAAASGAGGSGGIPSTFSRPLELSGLVDRLKRRRERKEGVKIWGLDQLKEQSGLNRDGGEQEFWSGCVPCDRPRGHLSGTGRCLPVSGA